MAQIWDTQITYMQVAARFHPINLPQKLKTFAVSVSTSRSLRGVVSKKVKKTVLSDYDSSWGGSVIDTHHWQPLLPVEEWQKLKRCPIRHSPHVCGHLTVAGVIYLSAIIFGIVSELLSLHPQSQLCCLQVLSEITDSWMKCWRMTQNIVNLVDMFS